MARRWVCTLLAMTFIGAFAVSATAGHWNLIYSDSDYLVGEGDYWDYSMTLQTGKTYRFLLTDIPWYSDFDWRIWRDFDHDGRYDGSDERTTSCTSGRAGDDEDCTFKPQASASSQNSTPYVLRIYSYFGSGWYDLYVYIWVP